MISTQLTSFPAQTTIKRESTIQEKKQNQEQPKQILKARWKVVNGDLICQWHQV